MGWWSRLFSKNPAPTTRREPTIDTPAPTPSGVDPGAVAPPAGPTDAAGHPAIDARAALHLRADSPEFDEYIARAELEAGNDLAHGARHLANLLVIDPSHAGWRALLDRYVAAAAGDPSALVPDVEPRHAATEALRAWTWQAQGRRDEAVSRLVDVAQALGSAALLHGWAIAWVEPPGAIESLPEAAGLKLFAALLTLNPEAAHASASQLASMRRWSTLLERAAPRWEDTSLLRMMRPGLMRKAGRLDEALELAGAIEDAVDFNAAAAIGLALRARGRLVESARAFEHATHIEPGNASGFVEAGDSWLEAGHWPDALAAYEAGLKLEPGDWAEASALYCRWKLEGDGPWRKRLGAAATAGSSRAHELLFREIGAIDESGDASADALRQFRARWDAQPPGATDGITRLALSTLESPSARLAIELELAARGRDAPLELVVDSVPAARDPRLPVAEVDYLLWRFDGTHALPALPAPDPAVVALVTALAAKPYHPHENWAQASHVAARLGPAAVEHLLSAMIHPAPVPPGMHALAWLPRVQMAAAMVLGQIDTGWEGSLRRAALRSLLLGPSDWTTATAISVLAWIGRAEPAHAQDIHRLFEERARHLPSEGHWDWVPRLYQQWATLPWLTEAERDALAAKLAAAN
ncbi:MAG: hypothetical protein JF586_13610 [Burkholderiales bacterium]|nr:hypothetical protein [Burkholderiales bacterium]